MTKIDRRRGALISLAAGDALRAAVEFMSPGSFEPVTGYRSGSPTPGCGYEDGDPYAAFLPPAIETDEMGSAEYNRAVVFVTDETRKGTKRSGQEYVNPLFVMTGEEYAKTIFDELLHRIQEAVRSGPRVVAEFLNSDGESHVFTEDDV